jgi:hypothetical protein
MAWSSGLFLFVTICTKGYVDYMSHVSLTTCLTGSVSSAAWQMACQRVIKMGERFVRDLRARAPEEERVGKDKDI